MMHAQKFSISMYFLPTDHMSMNSHLLAPGTGVFYLQGTTNKRVPATIVGSSSKADCVAIQYERSGHSQLYADCPLDRLTFPITHSDSAASDCDCAAQCAAVPALPPSSAPLSVPSSVSLLPPRRRDEVFGVEETVVACKPLRPPRPCLPSERVYIPLKCCVL